MRCDIGNADDITALVDATLAEYGRVDVLVNNAMTPTRGLFSDTDATMWDESMRINVRSLFLTAKAVAGPMGEQGSGSIINISSGAADPEHRGRHAARVPHLLGRQGRARAVQHRARARARADGHRGQRCGRAR